MKKEIEKEIEKDNVDQGADCHDRMVRDFLRCFNKDSGQGALPAFLEGYRILSCAYDRPEKSCYRVEDTSTGQKYLLKSRSCQDGRNVLKTEHQRICALAEAFPGTYQRSVYRREGDSEYLLRPYIEGMDLETYQEKNRPLGVEEVLRIVIGICGEMAKLHALTPPVLHRDIKPKNLIVDYRGSVHLIDFETARNYQKDKEKDTVFFGTQGNAAPEQYGYTQTDVRTDVYGIGKTLEFLYRENVGCKTVEKKMYRRIEKIIRKATAFDPAHRYQSVAALQHALEKLMNRASVKRLGRRLCLIGAAEAVAAVLLTFAHFFVTAEFHRLSEYAQGEGEMADIAAQESLLLEGDLDAAAAAMLGKEEMTQEDYEQITKLLVLGNQVYGADADIQELERKLLESNDEVYQIRGTIGDLSALSRMKNLKQVALCGQDITDISPLAGLPIEELYLSDNRIEDFSVVETLKQLRVLSIKDNPVHVLPRLSQCRQLRALSLNGNSYENLDFLEDSTVGALYLCDSYVENGDFSVLARLHNLSALYSNNNQYIFYEQLPALTQIKRLAIWNYLGQDLSVVKSLPQLESLIVTGNTVRSLDGVEAAAGLTELVIDWTAITDISRIKELPRLDSLKIKGNTIEDYTPLFECESLRTVIVNQEQMRQIDSMGKKRVFQMVED